MFVISIIMFPFFDFDIVFPCTSSFSSSISPADLIANVESNEEVGGSDDNGDEAGKENASSHDDDPVSSQAHTKNCCVFDGCNNETIGTLITCSECCVESTGEIVDTIKTLAGYMTELCHDDAVKNHLDSSLSGSKLNFIISDNTACSCGCGKPRDRGNVSCTTPQCQMKLNKACCVVGSPKQNICSTCRHRLACFREAGIDKEYAKTHFLSFSLPEEKTMKKHQNSLKQLSMSVAANTTALYTLPTGIPITKGEVHRLVTPDVWLNDQILEAFVYVLMESQKQAKYENKPFSDKKVRFLVVLYLYIFRQK